MANLNAKLLVYLAFAGLLTTGCGKLHLTLEGVNPLPSEMVPLGTGSEFVSGAQNGVLTTHGYRVDATVGAVFSQMESTTTNGYKVFSSVQGQISSDTTVQ